MFLVLF